MVQTSFNQPKVTQESSIESIVTKYDQVADSIREARIGGGRGFIPTQVQPTETEFHRVSQLKKQQRDILLRDSLVVQEEFHQLPLRQQHDILQEKRQEQSREQARINQEYASGQLSPPHQVFFPLSKQAQNRLPYNLVETQIKSPQKPLKINDEQLTHPDIKEEVSKPANPARDNKYTRFNNRHISRYSMQASHERLSFPMSQQNQTRNNLFMQTNQGPYSPSQGHTDNLINLQEFGSTNQLTTNVTSGESMRFLNKLKQNLDSGQVQSYKGLILKESDMQSKEVLMRWKGKNAQQMSIEKFKLQAEELGIQIKKSNISLNNQKKQTSSQPNSSNVSQLRNSVKTKNISRDSSRNTSVMKRDRMFSQDIRDNSKLGLDSLSQTPIDGFHYHTSRQSLVKVHEIINQMPEQAGQPRSPLPLQNLYFNSEEYNLKQHHKEIQKFVQEEHQKISKSYLKVPILSPTATLKRIQIDLGHGLSSNDDFKLFHGSSSVSFGNNIPFESFNVKQGNKKQRLQEVLSPKVQPQYVRMQAAQVLSPLTSKRNVLFASKYKSKLTATQSKDLITLMKPKEQPVTLIKQNTPLIQGDTKQYEDQGQPNQKHAGPHPATLQLANQTSEPNLSTLHKLAMLRQSIRNIVTLKQNPLANSPQSIQEELSEESEKASKLTVDKYLLTDNVQQLIQQIDQFRHERKSQNGLINNEINKIIEKAIKLGLKKKIPEIQRDIVKFLERRSFKDAHINSVKNPVTKSNCLIAQKSMKFICNLNGHKVERQGEQCIHGETDDNQQIQYLREYQKFYFFTHELKQQLEQEISNQVLIDEILRDLDKLTPQEKVLFGSSDQIQKLVNNPLLSIAISQNEIDEIEKQQEANSKKKETMPDESQLSSNMDISQTDVSLDILTFVTKRILAEKIKELIIDKNQLITKGQTKRNLFQVEVDKDSMFENFRKEILVDYLRSIYKEAYTSSSNAKEKSVTAGDNHNPWIDRRERLIEVDESLADKVRQMNKQFQLKKLMLNDEFYRISEQNRKISEDIISQEEELGHKHLTQKQTYQRHNVFRDFDQDSNFYKQAKQEVAGFHRETNQQSEFFKLCQQNNLLPQPIFKCIQDNELVYTGKLLSSTQAKVLSQFIQQNLNPDAAILHLKLDGCSLKDHDFATILKSIYHTRLTPCIQSIIYSNNNELGNESVQWLCKFIELENDNQLRAPKELQLCNLDIKSWQTLLPLMTCLAEHKEQIRKLQLSHMNLNSMEVVNTLCSFLQENKVIKFLTLQACRLQPQQLHQICSTLHDFKGHSILEEINLSGNFVAESCEKSQVHQAAYLTYLGDYAMETMSLASINLDGNLLGKLLIPFVIHIKNNKYLKQINLMNNHLTPNDEVLIRTVFEIMPTTYIQIKGKNVFEYFDREANAQTHRFKSSHLVEDNSFDQASAIVSQFANSGIIKQLRKQKHLHNGLQLNSQIGKTMVSAQTVFTSNCRSQDAPLSDKVAIKRVIGYDELVNSELGTNNFSSINFMKPFQWELKDLSTYDISKTQYICIHLNTEDPTNRFKRITDAGTVSFLKTKYGIHDISSQIQKGQTQYPLIFGTLTDWRVYQMLRPNEIAAALINKTKEDRQLITETVLDYSHFRPSDFQAFSREFHPLLMSIIESQNGLLVGDYKFEPKTPTKYVNSDFLFLKLIDPGKHSIFIYDPKKDVFYKKLVAVEVQQQLQPVRRVEADYQSIKQSRDNIQTRIRHCNDELQLICMVRDLTGSYYTMKQILKEEDGQLGMIVLKAVKDSYMQIIELFQALQAVSYQTYPLVQIADAAKVFQDFGVKIDMKTMKQVLGAGGMVRTDFINFLVLACQMQSPDYELRIIRHFMTEKISQILNQQQTDPQTSLEFPMPMRSELAKSPQIKAVSDLNIDLIVDFIDSHSVVHPLNCAKLSELVHKRLQPLGLIEVPIFKLRQVYIMSKHLLTTPDLSGGETTTDHLSLTVAELIEFIFRLSKHVFNRNHYFEQSEDQEQQLKLRKGVSLSKEMIAAFQSPDEHVRFQFTLQQIIGVNQLRSLEDNDHKQREGDQLLEMYMERMQSQQSKDLLRKLVNVNK